MVDSKQVDPAILAFAARHTPAYCEGLDRGTEDFTRCKPLPTNPFEEGTEQHAGWKDQWDYLADLALAGDYGY